MSEFDHGPPAHLAALFDEVPDPPVLDDFWFDWGPVFYRGRLDGSARVLCLASDPGPTERIAGRTPGRERRPTGPGLSRQARADALIRLPECLGLRRASLRAFPEKDRLDETAQLEWRNDVYDAATGPQLEAVIAFGFMAQAAVALWPDIPNGIEPHRSPPSVQSRGGGAPGRVARGDRRAPRRGHPRCRRRQHRAQLRLDLRGVRLRRRSRGAICRSGRRLSSATTPGCGPSPVRP